MDKLTEILRRLPKEQQDKIFKDIETIQAKSAVAPELKAFATLFLKVLAEAKSDFSNISKENQAKIDQAFAYLEQEHAKLQDNVSQVTDSAKKDFQNSLNEIKDLIKKIQTIKPIDGVDGYTPVKGEDYFTDSDIKEIKDEVLKDIPTVEEETGESIVQKINDLPIDNEDLKIDAKHVKNLPEQVRYYAGNSGIKEIIAGTNITVDNSNLGYPVISSTGGGGGTPGGSDTQLQYNNAGSFGGISGATSNGTNITFGTGNLLVTDVKASGSGGVSILNSSGGTVADFGAGGSTNATIHGAININTDSADYIQLTGGTGTVTNTATGSSTDIDMVVVPKGAGKFKITGNANISGLTASQLLATNASKDLVTLDTATYPSLTELSYVKGTTSSIQTQLNAKIPTSYLDTDTTLSANSDVKVATQRAVKTYVDNSVTGLLDLKGSIDCSTNPNYPSALKGDAYYVSVAGKVGGASGKDVDIGDVYIASADNAGGTEASVGSSWFVLEHNLSGVALTSGTLAQFAPTTSLQLKGVISDETGSGALVFADTPTLVTPILGTPTSGTLTNCTGLPLSGVASSTSTALGVGSLELGHASDTTLTRVSAGVVAIEGSQITTLNTVSYSGNQTQTLSVKTRYLLSVGLYETQNMTLPSTFAVGDEIEFIINSTSNAGTVNVILASGDNFLYVGTDGQTTSTTSDFVCSRNSSFKLVCTVANSTWEIVSIYGSGGSFGGTNISSIGYSIPIGVGDIMFTTASQTVTNKRNQPRFSSSASGNITPDLTNFNFYIRTALSATCTIGVPTGTPVNGEELLFRFKDNGTARTLSWNAIYRAMGTTIPTTTVISKTLYVRAIYNSTDTKWDVVQVNQEV